MQNKSIISLFLLITFFSFSQKAKTKQAIAPKEIFVTELLAKMTLDEKIGQLNLPTAGDIVTGQANSSNISKKIQEGQVGGLFNIKTAQKIYEVQKIAVEKSRLKIPLLFGMDVIHGYETVFPIPLGLSCSWDMNLIERTAQLAAKEASADGINWTFSPMVDLSRDPRWGRVSEGSGEDAFLGSQIAKAMVNGYQGSDLSKNNTLLSCVKHFALYGAPESGREYNTVDMSRLRMFNEYFPPYKAAVEAGVGSVMAAFNEVDGVPATANKWLMTEVLRKMWNFKGFVVTDYTAIPEMSEHGIGDLQTVSALALKAGIHMDMVGEGFTKTLKKSLEEGKINLDDIDAAVRLILNAKYDLGLFSAPYQYCDVERAKSDVFTKENREQARKIAAETFVLLKNERQVLPLKKSGTIALIGPLADNKPNMPGTWSVAANFEKSISIFQGFKEAVAGKATVLTARGSNVLNTIEEEQRNVNIHYKTSYVRDGRTDEQLLNEAIDIAKKADVIVAVLGESAEMSGECSSRTNLEIPEVQKKVLQELKKLGKPIVLILLTGRPLVLVEENQMADAILNVWFAGSEAGNAIADVVFGDVNPSGKLTMTFPQNIGQVPLYYNQKNTGRPVGNREGKFEKFKSNYLDVTNEPLFPFGFGLSYTTFSYKNIRASKDRITKNESIEISVDVTNTGNFDGKEVVQLYLRDVVGTITRPLRELKGFQKVLIKKGETKTITFEISEEDLKFYNSDLDYVAETGEFEAFIGNDSTAEMKINFVLD